MRGRSARQAALPAGGIVVAGEAHLPAVAGIRPSTSLPVVDLPQPDLPTRPSVRPACDRERDAVDRAQGRLAPNGPRPARTCSGDEDRWLREGVMPSTVGRAADARRLDWHGGAGTRPGDCDGRRRDAAGRRAGWRRLAHAARLGRGQRGAKEQPGGRLARLRHRAGNRQRGGGAARRGRQRRQQALRVGMRAARRTGRGDRPSSTMRPAYMTRRGRSSRRPRRGRG